jgi:hypothetical protein
MRKKYPIKMDEEITHTMDLPQGRDFALRATDIYHHLRLEKNKSVMTCNCLPPDLTLNPRAGSGGASPSLYPIFHFTDNYDGTSNATLYHVMVFWRQASLVYSQMAMKFRPTPGSATGEITLVDVFQGLQNLWDEHYEINTVAYWYRHDYDCNSNAWQHAQVYYTNAQLAAYSCFLGRPPRQLTVDEREVLRSHLVPGQTIRGLDSYRPGDYYISNDANYLANPAAAGVERETRRCLFQWGDPYGVYFDETCTTWTGLTESGFRCRARALYGEDTICEAQPALVMTWSNGAKVRVRQSGGRTWTATLSGDQTTPTLLDPSDGSFDEGSCFELASDGSSDTFFVEVNNYELHGPLCDAVIHTVSLWETGDHL